MSIETDLKKDGIEVIEALDTLKINLIAKNIAEKICATFPNLRFQSKRIIYSFIKVKYV